MGVVLLGAFWLETYPAVKEGSGLLKDDDHQYRQTMLRWTATGTVAGIVAALIAVWGFLGFPSLRGFGASQGSIPKGTATAVRSGLKVSPIRIPPSSETPKVVMPSADTPSQLAITHGRQPEDRKRSRVDIPRNAFADGVEHTAELFPQDDYANSDGEYTFHSRKSRYHWAILSWQWQDRASRVYLGLEGPERSTFDGGDLDNAVLSPKELYVGKRLTFRNRHFRATVVVTDVAGGPDNPRASKPYERVFYKLAFRLKVWEL
jgi:hypothetical protein